jgi:ribonuclease D
MSSSSLAPPILVADEESLGQLVGALASHPVVAVDTESNSLHAYRERVCLIQFSTPTADYIVDPIKVPDISALGPFFANPDQQKIFHAAEYDVVCMRRDYHFEFNNLFDTMSAARTLGWPQVGLADILATHFAVTMNKKYQRADWKRRPLTPEQLDYARLDTHYLVALRDIQLAALTASGGLAEAHEEFERLSRLRGDPAAAVLDPAAFWRVKGARDLGPGQAAVLKAVFAYREQQAERLDCPPFKVMGEATLLELARHAPRAAADLQTVPGMTPDQIRRYAQGLLAAIEEGLHASGQQMPQVAREPDDVRDRYDRLHTWRKNRAKVRGVESDVILPRTALWDLARRPPRTRADLEQIADFGPWRRETYGAEILALLASSRT